MNGSVVFQTRGSKPTSTGNRSLCKQEDMLHKRPTRLFMISYDTSQTCAVPGNKVCLFHAYSHTKKGKEMEEFYASKTLDGNVHPAARPLPSLPLRAVPYPWEDLSSLLCRIARKMDYPDPR